MKKTCPGVPAILVGNKKDLRDEDGQSGNHVYVKSVDGQKMAKRHKMKYLECSSLLDEGVSEVFNTVAISSLKFNPKRKREEE